MSLLRLQTFEDIVLNRRTIKDFDGTPITEELILKLLNLAVAAPNHRLTQPWKFKVLLQNGVRQWIDFLKDKLSPEEYALYEKTFERAIKAGALVYVSYDINPKPEIEREDYAAVSCAIEHILLGATALDLQSFWSTGKVFNHLFTRQFLKLNSDENFAGAIMLGRGVNNAPKPMLRMKAEEKTIWIK